MDVTTEPEPSFPAALLKLKLTMSAFCPASVRIFSAPPPIISGMCGCTGKGRPSKPDTCTCRPSTEIGCPPQWARSTSMVSASRSIRTLGRSWVMPMPSYSAFTQPAPIAASSRPPDRKSTVASSLASTTGWW